MNKYEVKQISNKKEWNEFANNFPYSQNQLPKISFVNSYDWSTFQQTLGNRILRIGIYKKENNTLEGVALGVIFTAKRGSYVHFRHNPLLDWNKPEIFTTLENYLNKFCLANGLWFARLSPLVEHLPYNDIRGVALHRIHKLVIREVEGVDNWISRLDFMSEDELFNSMKKKTRYEIRKAQKLCSVVISQSRDLVKEFYEIEKDTAERKNWTAFSQEFTQKEFNTFVESGNAHIILIKHEGVNIAGGIFLHFGKQTYYHFGASKSGFQHIPATYLMIWEAMKLAYKRGDKYFNFWGITPQNTKMNHPWAGLSSFKRKFTGESVHWAQPFDIVFNKKYYLTRLFEYWEKKKKGF